MQAPKDDLEHRNEKYKKVYSFIKAMKRDNFRISSIKYNGRLVTEPSEKAEAINFNFSLFLLTKVIK